MKLLNHYIDSQIKQHKNVVCTLLDDLISPDFIIIKNISQPFAYTYKENNISQTKPDVHLVIDRIGNITQLIPFNKQVCGEIHGSWGIYKNIKSRAIVIALENHGRLCKQDDSFISWEGTVLEKTDVFEGTHRNEDSPNYWEKYPKGQTLITEKINQCLVTTYKVKCILGYEEVCPGLKVDPGPAFPLEIMRNKLVKKQVSTKTNTGLDILNVTKKIDLSYILADNGFDSNNGKEAKIINIKQKNGGWYKVNVDLGGFLKEEWINL